MIWFAGGRTWVAEFLQYFEGDAKWPWMIATHGQNCITDINFGTFYDVLRSAMCTAWMDTQQGRTVAVAMGDVNQVLTRWPHNADLHWVRNIAVNAASPEMLAEAWPSPFAILRDADGRYNGVWRMPRGIDPDKADQLTRVVAKRLGDDTFPVYTFLPIPPDRDHIYRLVRDADSYLTTPVDLWEGPEGRRARLQAMAKPAKGAWTGCVFANGPQQPAKPRAEPKRGASVEDDARRRDQVVRALADYNYPGKVVDVLRGPVVTLYVFRPAPGTRSDKIVSLASDIARTLEVPSARIAPLPDRGAFGIEVPNDVRQSVELSAVLDSPEYRNSTAALPLALGVDIGGTPVVADLATMPHLLVAGTTGSGKSVGLNAMILSLLHRFSPDQCRFLMIDPKRLELRPYRDIPHLIMPVITEPADAVTALRWAVDEMMRRYKLLGTAAVRNIANYNAKIRSTSELLPYVVIVIDELTDLMAEGGSDVNDLLKRLGRLARAAGIHLIVATQKPTTNVLDTVLRSNLPARVAFRVSDYNTSKTILDAGGAEDLLGNGDMLYMSGGSRIIRAHGPFVSDDEVENACKALREMGEPQYVDVGGEDEAEGNMFAADEDVREVEVVRSEAGDGKTSVARACKWLKRALADGARLGAELAEEAERIGISRTTLDRAADEYLGVIKSGGGFGKSKTWSLT
jgi:Cdc6-like AAA superfamily ATPase